MANRRFGAYSIGRRPRLAVRPTSSGNGFMPFAFDGDGKSRAMAISFGVFTRVEVFVGRRCIPCLAEG